MSPGAAIAACLRKYATFSGRASRSEFWWFLPVCASVVVVMLRMIGGRMGPVFATMLLVPVLSAAARRLRDAAITLQSLWRPALVAYALLLLILQMERSEEFAFSILVWPGGPIALPLAMLGTVYVLGQLLWALTRPSGFGDMENGGAS